MDKRGATYKSKTTQQETKVRLKLKRKRERNYNWHIRGKKNTQV